MADPTPTRNTLGADVEITGSLTFAQELSFDGKLDGEILSEGALSIGRHGRVSADIATKSIVIHGEVTGTIDVSDRCELKAGAILNGDLKASRILIEEGATFIGKSEVTANKAKVKVNPA